MRELLIGNHALARGAWEAGVRVATAYPGTPSTEIIEALARYPEVYAEWAPNEKVALEVAIGASIGGARSLAAMKHVGVNVAADPLMTLAYTGVNAGLVLVSADDPGLFSSQNEQDNRFYARMAQIPCLEPADSQEVKDMTMLAFSLSEEFDTPVMLRLTTRIAHSYSLVEVGERREVTLRDYVKHPAKYVMLPAFGKARHRAVEERRQKLLAHAETSPLNRIEWADRRVGVITAGIAYQYVKEALPGVSVLKLGLTYPLPEKLVRAFVHAVGTCYVVEELEPFLEDQLRALGLSVAGKELVPRVDELSSSIVARTVGTRVAALAPELVAPDLAAAALPGMTAARDPAAARVVPAAGEEAGGQVAAASNEAAVAANPNDTLANAGTGPGVTLLPVPGSMGTGTAPGSTAAATAVPAGFPPAIDLPGRPPLMCPGCPHRGVFYVLKKLGLVVAGDIGCYTLGATPPLQAMDTCICMGASLGVAMGLEKARGPEFARRVVAVIGDSTFLHSGMTGLLDMVYNGGTGTLIILDNGTTAMTGHQDHPGTGYTASHRPAPRADLEQIARGLGVQRVQVVDSYDLEAVERAIQEETAALEPSVIIARRPCALLKKEKEAVYTVDPDTCLGCRYCLEPGCPALSFNGEEAVIDPVQCNGCGLCARVCPAGAIRKAGEEDA
ncbi:MAG: indolepyruvate ferredoxin oxidoreductase, alpha subunit [Moorella sp. (in: firmicutes)]|nr:indolepyruvate ferredoxin oxidoreductase, alpha subunit [Moorella sp. (in: firmicutes)]